MVMYIAFRRRAIRTILSFLPLRSGANLKRRRGLAVLMAEQGFRQAIKIADRGYVLMRRQIVLSAENPQGLQQNELVRRYYLGVG